MTIIIHHETNEAGDSLKWKMIRLVCSNRKIAYMSCDNERIYLAIYQRSFMKQFSDRVEVVGTAGTKRVHCCCNSRSAARRITSSHLPHSSSSSSITASSDRRMHRNRQFCHQQIVAT